jgi:hypothetical protein
MFLQGSSDYRSDEGLETPMADEVGPEAKEGEADGQVGQRPRNDSDDHSDETLPMLLW